MAYVKELEKSIEAVTLQDCLGMANYRNTAAIISNGRLAEFNDEPYACILWEKETSL